MKSSLVTLFLALLSLQALAQGAMQVASITIEGNKRTKENIILRELDFGVGDEIAQGELTQRLERNRLLLINTGLFNKVEINIAKWEGTQIDLAILVKEDWYIYPIPILELADRNFNVWWNDYDHAFNRLNVGLRFYFENLSGRNDRLKVVTQFGYTQKYELEYRLPFLNKGQSLGLSYNILYTRNREVSVNTVENKQDFRRFEGDFSMLRFRNRAKLTYRPGLFVKHEIEATYHRNQISDSIVFYNPEFFLDGKKRQQYFSLGYQYSLDHRDNKDYPLEGYFLGFTVEKEGFGWSKEVNQLRFSGTLTQSFPIKNRFGYEFILKAKTALIKQPQPYYKLSQALGYEEDFVRGYEYYVIDGLNYAYFKNSLRFKLLDKAFMFKAMPINALKYFPVKIYLRVNGDLGYVNNPYENSTNDLQNQLLIGGGPGLDFVLYHEYVFRFEYSFNHLGESGLFFHYKFFF